MKMITKNFCQKSVFLEWFSSVTEDAEYGARLPLSEHNDLDNDAAKLTGGVLLSPPQR